MAALISDEFEKLKECVAEALGIPRRMLDDDYELSSESSLKLTGGELPGNDCVNIIGGDGAIKRVKLNDAVKIGGVSKPVAAMVGVLQKLQSDGGFVIPPDSEPDPKAAAMGETLSAANRKVGR